MLPSLTFNNIRKSYIAVMEKKRPYRSTRKIEMVNVPERAGAYPTGETVDVIVIPVKFLIDADSAHLLQEISEDLAAWLTTKNPAPLIFDDQPNRTYMALTEGEFLPDEFVSYAEMWINFVVPDGEKLGPERNVDFTADTMTLVNEGTKEAPPIFRAEVLQDITNLDIVGMEGYMRIGAPAAVNQTPVSSQTKILTDEMGVLTGWTVASAVDNGHVSGQMEADGDGFKAALWGTIIQPAAWQGPSLRRQTPEALQNFIMEVEVIQENGNIEAGMLEVYLRDANGNIVAKIGISDEWRNSRANRGKFQLGNLANRKDFNAQPGTIAAWDKFRGVLRITRNGQQFTAYFAQVDSAGIHSVPVVVNYFDSLSQYQAPVTTVQVSMRKWPDADIPPTTMKIKKLELWRLNTTTASQPVFIARAGDVIEINHENGDITINGESRTWLKDFGGTYFKLQPGPNLLTFSPTFAASLSVRWRERYL